MLEFVVVVENNSDARHICTLADRVFAERVDWIDATTVDNFRLWRGFEAGTTSTTWREIKTDAKQKLPRFRRRTNDEPQGIAYAESRKVIALVEKLQRTQQIDALILFKDLDNQPERRAGMRQARKEVEKQILVVLATAKWKREAWILNGFEPSHKREEELLADLCQKLGFDPRLNAENLHHLTTDDSKHILDALLQDHASGKKRYEREEQCWLEVSLETLRQRGKETLLTDYLDEVETHLL
ncbi:MAG: hypothetical protein HYR56_06160 [Acidobacteria bacterium]|nr:hypothetical protein [Acidobacteriota bacterium]MBI3427427.1 hypothetical protein [Acidobacteriota bacterium]